MSRMSAVMRLSRGARSEDHERPRNRPDDLWTARKRPIREEAPPRSNPSSNDRVTRWGNAHCGRSMV